MQDRVTYGAFRNSNNVRCCFSKLGVVRIHLASGHQCGPVTSRDEVTDSWYREMTVSVIPTTVNIV